MDNRVIDSNCEVSQFKLIVQAHPKPDAPERTIDVSKHDANRASAVSMPQSAGCRRRRFEHCEIVSSVEVATCKIGDFPEKWPISRLPRHLGSQNEKKIDAGAQDLSRFFDGTSFALESLALTISSPETQRVSPSKGRAT